MFGYSESQKMAVKTDHVEQYATKCQSSSQLICQLVLDNESAINCQAIITVYDWSFVSNLLAFYHKCHSLNGLTTRYR